MLQSHPHAHQCVVDHELVWHTGCVGLCLRSGPAKKSSESRPRPCELSLWRSNRQSDVKQAQPFELFSNMDADTLPDAILSESKDEDVKEVFMTRKY